MVRFNKKRQNSSTVDQQPLPPVIITYQSDEGPEVSLRSQFAADFEESIRSQSDEFHGEASVDEFTFQNTEKGDDDHQSIAFSIDGQSCM